MKFYIGDFFRKADSFQKKLQPSQEKNKPTLEATLFRSFFSVSAVLLLLSLGITMYCDITRQRKEIDSTISGIATYIASLPQVADMLKIGYPSDSIRRDLDSLCSNTANLNVVLICNKNGLRFYHTDRNTTGETVTNGDEAAVLEGSPPYITTVYGSFGTQRCAFHSIQDHSGSVIGYVMASVFTAHLSDRHKQIVTLYLTVLGFMLLVSLILSRCVVILLRGRLMGHEPEELLDLCIRQDAVLGSLEEGLIAADHCGKILFANQAASSLLCISASSEQLEGKQIRDVFPGTDFSDLSAIDTCQTEEIIGSHTLLVKTVPIMEENSIQGVLMVLNDRTEMLRMSDELSGTRATLDTLRAFNHEFMNKLHIILGYLQTGEIKKAITFIVNSSLVSSQALRETAERIRVSSICALIIGKMMHAAELGIRLSLSPDSICLEHNLLIPTEEMITIIGNLLENAVEELADPCNDDKNVKEIELSLFCQKNFNLIVCEDTGRGIPKKLADRICCKGFSTKGENRGLGLSLIKSISLQYGGEMTIETEENEGTVFTLIFT